MLLAYTSLYAPSLCLFIAGRQQEEPDPDSWPGVAAMNDLITAYEIVCYKVNAVHYLKQSQGTNMVKLNHALHNAAAALPPCVIRLRPAPDCFPWVRNEKEVLQSFWNDQQIAETAKVPGLK